MTVINLVKQSVFGKGQALIKDLTIHLTEYIMKIIYIICIYYIYFR